MDLKKRIVERALAGELTRHLGCPAGEKSHEVEKPRNGYSSKKLLAEDAPMEIEVPREKSKRKKFDF